MERGGGVQLKNVLKKIAYDLITGGIDVIILKQTFFT
jgi:hypothetical protein